MLNVLTLRGCCERFQCTRHTRHRLSCFIFVWEKKKRFYFPNNWHKWNQQPFSFTDKTKLMYHKSFINIFTALNHFQASYKHNSYACYVVLDTCRVPNNFSPQRSGVKTLRADEKWKARYIYISCFYHRCNTKQPGRLFAESVQSLHQLTVTVCTFLCQSMPVYGLFSWYYFRLWKLIKIKVFTRWREMFLQTGRLFFKQWENAKQTSEWKYKSLLNVNRSSGLSHFY